MEAARLSALLSPYFRPTAEDPSQRGCRPLAATSVRRDGLIYILSHKTRKAVRGPAYDLHQSARDWLVAQGFFDPARVGMSPEHVFFGETRQEKINSITRFGCTVFIDDLEETFAEPTFPKKVEKMSWMLEKPAVWELQPPWRNPSWPSWS